MKAIDRREEIRGALHEAHERAHRERAATLSEISADPIERREQTELLVDEPSEPVAGDLAASVGRGQRDRRRAREAAATTTRRSFHDTPPLVLLHDV